MILEPVVLFQPWSLVNVAWDEKLLHDLNSHEGTLQLRMKTVGICFLLLHFNIKTKAKIVK